MTAVQEELSQLLHDKLQEEGLDAPEIEGPPQPTAEVPETGRDQAGDSAGPKYKWGFIPVSWVQWLQRFQCWGKKRGAQEDKQGHAPAAQVGNG